MLGALEQRLQPHLRFRPKQLVERLLQRQRQRWKEGGGGGGAAGGHAGGGAMGGSGGAAAPSPVAPVRVLIMGGGPMGLRCAAELETSQSPPTSTECSRLLVACTH